MTPRGMRPPPVPLRSFPWAPPPVAVQSQCCGVCRHGLLHSHRMGGGTPVSCAAGGAPRGFTLVELLVVMVLLSLLMLGMGSALSSAAQTETRVDARLARLDQLRTTSQFLREALGHVVSRDWRHPALPTGASFKGVRAVPNAIEWAGIMPARHGLGGPCLFRLALEPGPRPDAPALVLRYVPWVPGPNPAFPDWNTAAARVLVKNAAGLAVKAKADWPDPGVSAANWRPGWQNGWDAAALPTQIELDIADAQGAWPALIVALRPAASSGGSNVDFGGRR